MLSGREERGREGVREGGRRGREGREGGREKGKEGGREERVTTDTLWPTKSSCHPTVTQSKLQPSCPPSS